MDSQLGAQDVVFADLIRLYSEVTERLRTVMCFREAKPRLPVVQATAAAGYPQPTLYACEGRFDGDPDSLAEPSWRLVASQDNSAWPPEVRAAIPNMRERFSWGHREDLGGLAGGLPEDLHGDGVQYIPTNR